MSGIAEGVQPSPTLGCDDRLWPREGRPGGPKAPPQAFFGLAGASPEMRVAYK